MTEQDLLLRSQIIPIAMILIAHVGGYLTFLPIFVQLLLNSCACVYIGCMIGNKIRRKNQNFEKAHAAVQDSETIGTKEAMKFPIVASAFLFGFYIIYKYVNKDIINLVITLYFCLATILSNTSIIESFLPFPESLKIPIIDKPAPNWMKKYLDCERICISNATLIALVICTVPVVFYFMTKNWILNNIFGIQFSLMALKYVNLSSFKVGFFLLWALFCYDIFWVYGTDVMVSVAKNLDIPIKLLFPYINATGQLKYSMLGLGDIVLPGIFVSLCMKIDIDKAIKGQGIKPKSPKDFPLTYFHFCFISYALGIVETFAAMYIFDHPQPALLFLVPMCTLSATGVAFAKGQWNKIYNYENDAPKKQKALTQEVKQTQTQKGK